MGSEEVGVQTLPGSEDSDTLKSPGDKAALFIPHSIRPSCLRRVLLSLFSRLDPLKITENVEVI